MPVVVEPGALSGDGEWLARARPCPDGAVVGPSSGSKRERPSGDPSVLLADEPTAALDAENGRAVMSVLARIARDSARGVLVVTHDPRISSFADRVVHIEDGRIISDSRAAGSQKVA